MCSGRLAGCRKAFGRRTTASHRTAGVVDRWRSGSREAGRSRRLRSASPEGPTSPPKSGPSASKILYRRHGMRTQGRGRPLNAPAAFIHPCQLVVATQPPSGPGWAHELKHDGYRLQIHVRDGRVRLYTIPSKAWLKIKNPKGIPARG